MWYVGPAKPQCLSLEYFMTPRLLTEQHLEFLSLTEGFTGSSESTLVKMPHCWKSHVVAQLCSIKYSQYKRLLIMQVDVVEILEM